MDFRVVGSCETQKTFMPSDFYREDPGGVVSRPT